MSSHGDEMVERGAKTARDRAVPKLDLALQGGGAHGAFTWGVLERLLEEDRIDVGAVSGASAGAMNAVVLASGLITGGPEGASRALWAFWKAVNRAAGRSNPALRLFEAFPFLGEASLSWWSSLLGGRLNWMPAPEAGAAAQAALRQILLEQVDFAALNAATHPRLFISATNARTGAQRLFRNPDLTPDAVLASACLPLVFPPVEIDGEDHWDGGYSANPALLPLIVESENPDLLLVTINPIARRRAPGAPREILDRINELMFNQSLVKDIRAVSLLKETLAAGGEAAGGAEPELLRAVRALLLHEIHDEDTMLALDPQTKLVPDWRLLMRLRAAGRRGAERWLELNLAHVGRRSTAELAGRFL